MLGVVDLLVLAAISQPVRPDLSLPDLRNEAPYRANICDLKKNPIIYRDRFIRIKANYTLGDYALFYDPSCQGGLYFYSSITDWRGGTGPDIWSDAFFWRPGEPPPMELEIDVAGILRCYDKYCRKLYIVGSRLYSVTRVK
jgi:hypothetical protein